MVYRKVDATTQDYANMIGAVKSALVLLLALVAGPGDSLLLTDPDVYRAFAKIDKFVDFYK